MWKLLMVTMAALAIAGSSLVYAQQRDGDRAGGARFEHHHHKLSPEDRAAFVDARIAALKAGLELTPDQAKNWPMFEQALRDMAQLRAQFRAAREARRLNPQPTTPFERMTRRADNMAKKSAALKRIADAGTPLYQSLNDAQKERFEKLARMLRPHHYHERA
jgi:zinc resistance-associated protein